jgi:hypothetical protein
MSTRLNKVVGAILAGAPDGAVVSMLGVWLAPRRHGPAAVSVASAPSAPKQEIKIEPVSGPLAAANIDNGKKIVQMLACHTLDGGANKIGEPAHRRPFASHRASIPR